MVTRHPRLKCPCGSKSLYVHSEFIVEHESPERKDYRIKFSPIDSKVVFCAQCKKNVGLQLMIDNYKNRLNGDKYTDDKK